MAELMTKPVERIAPDDPIAGAVLAGFTNNFDLAGFTLDPTEVAEIDAIALYLNFDMIGSPNPGYFVYDEQHLRARCREAVAASCAAASSGSITTRRAPASPRASTCRRIWR